VELEEQNAESNNEDGTEALDQSVDLESSGNTPMK